MKRSFAAAAEAGESVEQIKDRLDREAQAIHDEDIASCRALGAFGAEVVPADARILTHCNAGALATAGYRTALGVGPGAVERGQRIRTRARSARGVTLLPGGGIPPAGALIRNPAFAVTPHPFIAGIIPGRGIFRPPSVESWRRALDSEAVFQLPPRAK